MIDDNFISSRIFGGLRKFVIFYHSATNNGRLYLYEDLFCYIIEKYDYFVISHFSWSKNFEMVLDIEYMVTTFDTILLCNSGIVWSEIHDFQTKTRNSWSSYRLQYVARCSVSVYALWGILPIFNEIYWSLATCAFHIFFFNLYFQNLTEFLRSGHV